MTHILNTTLLGQERAEATIPYKNIGGRLYTENGGLAFWSNNQLVWFAPFENLKRWGWDGARWRRDVVHRVANFAIEAYTLGFFSVNRYLYLWIVYYDERVGKDLEVWFLVSDFWLNEGKGDELVRLIGDEIATYRDGLRHATRPR